MTPFQNDPVASTEALTLPELSAAEWGKLGGGIALVLAGSGLVSLGTLLRLGVVVGGGALAYRTWAGRPAAPSSGDEAPAPFREQYTESAAATPRPSLREVLASDDGGPEASLANANDLPTAIDLRGA